VDVRWYVTVVSAIVFNNREREKKEKKIIPE